MIKETEEMIEAARNAGRIEIVSPGEDAELWFIVTPTAKERPRNVIAAGGEADIRLLAARLAVLIEGLKLTNADQFSKTRSNEGRQR